MGGGDGGGGGGGGCDVIETKCGTSAREVVK